MKNDLTLSIALLALGYAIRPDDFTSGSSFPDFVDMGFSITFRCAAIILMISSLFDFLKREINTSEQ